MSASPDGGSAIPASPAYDHGCQSGCGRPLDTIIVELTSGTADFLCRTCAVAMFVAVAAQLAGDGLIDMAGGVAPPLTP